MKNKSLFSQIITVVVLIVICVFLTLFITLLAGSLNVDLFDFRHLNYSNVIPVLIICIFLSCVAITVSILFLSRTAILKAKEFLNENNENNGGTKK